VKAAVAAQSREAVEALRTLVRTPSVTGDENAAQECMRQLLVEAGMTVDVFTPTRDEVEGHPSFSDDGLPLGDRTVVVGHLGATSGPQIVLNGHIDVVPVGDERRWRHPPWSGAVRDGAVWGRGSCDMKGGLVAAWAALRAVATTGRDLPVGVTFVSVIGEETGGVGTLSTLVRGLRGDAAIVLEPTRGEVCPVGAGALSFELDVEGRAAHGAMRREGVSAVDKATPVFDALHRLERERNRWPTHPLFGPDALPAPISVGTVSAGDWLSTVPERLIARGRFGVLPDEAIEDARLAFEQAVGAAAATDAWLAAHPPTVRWIEGQFAPARTPTDATVVTALADAHRRVTGVRIGMHGVPYGSDLRFYVNDAGMPAVLYGPGDVAWAHAVDEHVRVDDVLQVATVLATALLSWPSRA
jgi:acetylornithine deacetylase